MVMAKKSLGQNFLKDEAILEQIIEASELKDTDTILEIGPGHGALTKPLLDSGARVTAVELDDDLLPFLKMDFGKNKNFELIHGDALTHTPPNEPYKIVANIPYYITSPLINHYLYEQFLNGNPPELLVIMVQKEVAEKIVAKNGKHSVLSLQVHIFGEPELVCIAPSAAFKPAPKVDSAVIKVRVHKKPKIHGELKKIFWLFHISFAQKRKKLANNLAAALRKKPAEIKPMLKALNIDPDIRAEQLSFEEWSRLFQELKD
jgi:16S rRNA (adenine1518-N6/adenine1519-N6)-dimethyltransferase